MSLCIKYVVGYTADGRFDLYSEAALLFPERTEPRVYVRKGDKGIKKRRIERDRERGRAREPKDEGEREGEVDRCGDR